MTADENAELARKLRHAAEQAERLAMLQKWVGDADLAQVGNDITVSWRLGRAVPGYDDLSRIVSKMVAPMIPDLIRKAVAEIEANVHIACRNLPAPPGPK